jgi:trimethylamine:corrinoid methyltransferase-like protein
MASGLVLGLGNLIAQYAWAFAGLTVTNIIRSSMTVVLGKHVLRNKILLN